MSLGSGSNFFLGAASAGAGGYKIERSLRFDSSSSSYLNRTPSSAGNRKTWTWAGWFKPSNIGGTGSSGGHSLFSVRTGSGDSGLTDFIYNTDGTLLLTGAATTFRITTAKFRDFSAWYHIVLQLDTTQATAADRIKIYVNGSRITEFSTNNNPAQNADLAINNATLHKIGGYSNVYLAGYLADVHFIDGQALDPTDFGEFDDNNVWQPIEYAGTYGTNGFYLDFSDNSSVAALGTDTSGNGNDWTVNNIIDAGNGTLYRSLEVIEPDPNGSVANIQALFNPTYIGNYINTSTWAITNTAWLGAYNSARDVLRWTPRGGYAVTSSFRVYYGCYDNTAKSTTLTITYTDASTETDSMTSGNNNWMKLFTTSNAAGKTIEKVELSIATPSATNLQFGAFVVDDQIVTSLNTDTDSFIDSPTNGTQTDTGAGGEVSGNYATLNPLVSTADPTATLTDGNLTASFTSALNYAAATIGITTGKYYYEMTASTNVSSSDTATYIRGCTSEGTSETFYHWRANGGTSGLTGSPTLSTYASGDVLGVGIDATNSTVRFYKNGTLQGSGDYSYTTFSGKALFISAFANPGNRTCHWNFGQRAFAYSAPSGYKALCTANLPDPTIADGSTEMDVVLYNANGSTQTISGLGFSPDLVWSKSRNRAYPHGLHDSVRGAYKYLRSNGTNTETDTSGDPATYTLTSFDADGFSVGQDGGAGVINNNAAGATTYVAWAWDAGTSTVTNNDGSITSQVRANPSAGFSIVSYTGNGVGAATIGHGLNVAPAMIILKQRDQTDNWVVGHTTQGWSSVGFLNLTNAWGVISYFNNTAPASTTFQLSGSAVVNGNGNTYVAYCFAPVEGYSAFGSYTGNLDADGPFVYTGFRPRWILFKNASASSDWRIRGGL